MDLNRDFKEFIALLNVNDVDYLLIGGYAVGFHGYPRFTQDIDIWIELSEDNIKKLFKTLNDFGFPVNQLKKKDFLKPNVIFQMGNPPYRIDIINSIEGVRFEHCYKRKIRFKIDDIVINIISLKDLKKNKKATGRLIDLNDLAYLQKK
jgi:hypothetical protein